MTFTTTMAGHMPRVHIEFANGNTASVIFAELYCKLALLPPEGDLQLDQQEASAEELARFLIKCATGFDIDKAIELYRQDPADCEYQQGFLAALMQVFNITDADLEAQIKADA